ADSTRALQQAQALFDSGAVSREALDSATSRQRSARAALEAAQANAAAASASLEESLARLDSISRTGAPLYQAQVESARAAVKSAQLAWDNTMVKAPVGGTVVRIAAQTGENVAAGQTLLTLVDLETTWVVANIDEGKIGRIRPGQEVEVRIDAYPGRKLKGRVAEVGAATQSTFALIPAENTSGNYTKVSQRVPIRIRVERNGLVLKPGMSAVVKIHTGTDR
ncbi:MAG: efflux RND transporter periplasmic adaptor subunit, partial [Syntrophomonadaceae bacterium]|nr:efflux RND transporter periplasmic adaptor subunit [Syntrophomonadaceae bacterium]